MSPPPRPSRPFAKLVLVLVTLVVTVVLVELGARVFGARFGIQKWRVLQLRRLVEEGVVDAYDPRPHTVYARHRNQSKTNSLGFMDKEWRVERTPGVPRILCLGGSTTEGGNQAAPQGSYPWQLEELLEERTGRDFEVLNAGMSSWTTAETLAAWFLLLKDYRPDLVLIHHVVNDLEPRSMRGFRPDYTHYRHHWTPPRFGILEGLLIRWSDIYAWKRIERLDLGVPDFSTYPVGPDSAVGPDGLTPPETMEPYRRNLLSIAEDAERQGAEVAFLTMPQAPIQPGEQVDWFHRKGMVEHNQLLRDLARERGWLLIDAEAAWEPFPLKAAMIFTDLVHLNPGGNLGKAMLVADALAADWLPRVLGETGPAGLPPRVFFR